MNAELALAFADRLKTVSPLAAGRIAWDGLNGPRFDPPAIDHTDPAASIWMRPSITVAPRSGTPRALGPTAQTRNTGLLQIQLFTPRNHALADALAHADTLAAAFHRKTFAGVNCRDADPVAYDGEDPELPAWYRLRVVVPYRIDGTL